jgi:hypothetical protein
LRRIRLLAYAILDGTLIPIDRHPRWRDHRQPVPRGRSDNRDAAALRAAHSRRRQRLFDGVPPLKLEQVSSWAATGVTPVTYRVRSSS